MRLVPGLASGLGRPAGSLLAALAVLLVPTACGDSSADPGARAQRPVVARDPMAGDRASVLLPTGRLDLTVGTPVDAVPADRTKDLKAVSAPDGGSLVPVSWTFDGSQAPWLGLLAAHPDEAVVSLQVGGRSYRVGPPYQVGAGGTIATDPDRAFYVPVGATPDPADIAVSVAYDGLTQVVHPATGESDLGVAAGLARLEGPRPGGVPCPDHGWRAVPRSVDVQVDCTISLAGRTPYWPTAGWAEAGHQWLVLDVPEVRLLRAVARGPHGSTTYRVADISDLSRYAGRSPRSVLGQQQPPRQYVAGGVQVFDVAAGDRGTLRLALRFSLEADDVQGHSSAPDTVSLRVTHEVPLGG